MEEPRPEDIEESVRELEQEYGTDESLPPEAGMKARVCPKCSKHNLENAWHCIDCGTTLSMKTLMDMEDGQSSGLSSISPYFEQDVAEILDTVVQNGESVILGCNISFGYLLVTSQRLIRVQFQPEVTKGATRVDWLDVLVNLLSFLAEPIDILSPSRPLSKATLPATLVAPLEKKGQRISELLAPFSQP